MSHALRRISILVLSLFALNVPAAAQTYPERPVRIINPFPAGGSLDITGRVLAQKLSERFDTPFVLENRTGAAGNVGAEAVARSAPDGYTLLYSAAGPLTVNHKLTAGLPYDPTTDFAPIAVVVRVPLVLVANPKLPVANVQELIDLARKKPGSINFGSAGLGTIPHLTGELFKHVAKVDITHIPYKGTGPAMSDLVAGHIEIMFDVIPATIQQISAKTVRALGNASATRPAALADLPTVSEQGVAGFAAASWFALVAPAKTPEPVLARLRAAVDEILKSDDFVKRLADLGTEPGTADEKEVQTFFQSEVDKWTEVIHVSGAKSK